MPTLFTITELATFIQAGRAPDDTGQGGDPPSTWLDDGVAQLAHDLVVDAIRGAVGAARFDPGPVPPGVKAIAVPAAARIVLNPEMLDSTTIGGVTDRHASGTVHVELTGVEITRLRAAYGLTSSGVRSGLGTVRVASGYGW